jgi:SAM-dependent methyltransferase
VQNAAVENEYDAMAESYEEHASESPYNAYYDRPAMLELVGDIAGRRVLDAGCGPGLYAEELVSRGADVVAVDGSAEMVRLARRRLDGRATVIQADLDRRLPFEDAEFDLLVCALVISHLDSREAFLREAFRVLRPGGHCVVSTTHPTTDWLRKGGSYFDVRLEEDTWQRDERSYRVQFWREPLSSLCAAIADAGFLIERLVEPLPTAGMRDAWPIQWERLQREPGFVAFRLLKP